MPQPSIVTNYYNPADTFKNIIIADGGGINSDGGVFTSDGAGNLNCVSLVASSAIATGQLQGGQSASAPAIANNGTINTAGVRSARVNPGAAVTGIILQAGTQPGQEITVVNEAAAANSVTFAAVGTSNVADGVSSVIAGLNARRFIWDSAAGTPAWFPCK